MRKRVGALLWAGIGSAFAVHSLEAPPNLQFSAFGTLGVAATDTHAVGFRRDNSQRDGAIDQLTAKVDSRLGVQVSSRLGDNLLATFQVVSKYRYDGTYTPEIVWACLAWNPVGNLQLRAGGFNWDTLPNSDFSHVGYTYLWIRPPADVFGASAVSRFKGVELTDTREWGTGTFFTWRVLCANSVGTLPVAQVGPWDVSGGRVWGGMLKLQSGAWRGLASYTSFRLSRNLPGVVVDLQDGLRAAGGLLGDPRPALAAQAIDTRGLNFRNLVLGGAWEEGRGQAQGALVRTTAGSFLFPSSWSGFVSFGYRLGPAVPYLVFSRAVTERTEKPDLGGLASLPASLGALAQQGQALAAGVDLLATARAANQNTFSAGVRWDLGGRMDLKVQVDRIHSHNSSGLMYDLHPDRPGQWNGKATVLAVALDFIFGGGRNGPGL